MISYWNFLLFALFAVNTVLLPQAKADQTSSISIKANEKVEKIQPKAIAYLTSWQLPNNATELLRTSKADAYILSFAKWDEHGNITSSDDIIKAPPLKPKKVPQGYLTWTQIAHSSPQTQMIISFGGQDYEGIWDTMGNTEVIAKSIAELLEQNFPVYQEVPSSNCQELSCKEQEAYKIIGHTQLSGVDFDFEQASRLTEEQNQQLILLAKRVRELVGKSKSIALTTYHVGADPLDCLDPKVIKGCSFREPDRSSHHGEVLSLLKSTVGLFDFYNVMAYDAGRNFDYKTSIDNYFRAIGNRSDLRLGISINQQWGQLGHFVMPVSANNARVKWQATQGVGGFFVWALGASSEARSLDSQILLFNSLVDNAKTAETQ